MATQYPSLGNPTDRRAWYQNVLWLESYGIQCFLTAFFYVAHGHLRYLHVFSWFDSSFSSFCFSICSFVNCGEIYITFGQWVKNSSASAGDAGDMGSIPGSRRSPGGACGNPLQNPCLGNPVDRGVWRAIGSQRVGHAQSNRAHTQEHTHTYIPFTS